MEEEICPKDEVPTIRRDSLEEQSTYIPEGTILGGRYRIVRLIGVGGMGEVYLGTQTNMDRRVAIKTLKKEFMSNERLLKRFYREARAAAALDHPNIVKVYDFGLDPDQGCPYIAMEYLEGISLDALIESEGQLNETRTCLIVGSVARALTDAHSKGVVHRDLKPDNVHVQSLTDGTEHVKVLDFGIAKIRRPDGTPTEKLTGTGMALGTPYYMSPEQAMGKPADFRSDLYSLGCIIYQLVAGKLPFDAEQPMAVVLKQLREPAPNLPNILCDGVEPTDTLTHLYHSLMAKSPEQRPDSTLAVADRLKDCVRLSRGETIDGGKSGFEFGNRTLGPKKSVKPVQLASEPGLETLVRTSLGEKATLAFGAASDHENEYGQMDLAADSDDQLQAVNTRRLKPMVVAALVLLAGAAAAFILNEQPSETLKPSATPEIAQPTLAKSAPEIQTVSITSEPSGATVMNGKLLVGVTPVQTEFKVDDMPASIRVSLDGHREAKRIISSSDTRVNVLLEKSVPVTKPSAVSTPTVEKNNLVRKKTVQAKPARKSRKLRPSAKRSKPRRGLKNGKPTSLTMPSRKSKSSPAVKRSKSKPKSKSSKDGSMEIW
jgi:serine/threonine-protein kinase